MTDPEDLQQALLETVAADAEKLIAMAKAGDISNWERRAIAEYLRSVSQVVKDRRDAELGKDLSQLTDEAIIELARKLVPKPKKLSSAG